MIRNTNCSGCKIVPDIFPSRRIDSLLTALEAAVLSRSRAGARHLMSHAAIAQIAHDPRMLEVASEFLRGEPLPFRATLFDKSPAANWLVAWHQDTALPLRERRDTAGWGPWSVKAGVWYAHAPASALERVIALRLHLDDSTSENGPLRVLPGTHTFGVLSDDEIAAFLCSSRPVPTLPVGTDVRGLGPVAPVECLVSRGGIVAMRPLIVHASSKSVSPLPRRVLHIEYADTMIFDGGLTLVIA
jgi:ectoine hydroxylase-related dioxygenase (phytanoyl-CoA dioxygenase family)